MMARLRGRAGKFHWVDLWFSGLHKANVAIVVQLRGGAREVLSGSPKGQVWRSWHGFGADPGKF